MHFARLAVAIAEDLAKVARSNPNEKLPKEEQIRSCLYAELRPEFEVVCVERGYDSIEKKSTTEVDIWARRTTGEIYWIEIKRFWHVGGRGWIHKPDEQLSTWQADLNKLARVSITDTRIFILVGLLAVDPDTNLLEVQKGAIRRLNSFHPDHRSYQDVFPFAWRESPVSRLSISIWEWKRGEAIS